MSDPKYPQFDRFCRFIGAVEGLTDVRRPSDNLNPEELLEGRQRLVAAFCKAGLAELTWKEVRDLTLHVEAVADELAALVHRLPDLASRYGLSEHSSMGEILARVPTTDLRGQIIEYDLNSMITDATEAWRRLGRRGRPTGEFKGNIPPGERITVLAYALRNGMLEE